MSRSKQILSPETDIHTAIHFNKVNITICAFRVGPMAYCAFCLRLIAHFLAPSGELTPAWRTTYRRWELEKDCDFKNTVQQCELCRFLYQGVEKRIGKQVSDLDEKGKLRRISLFNRYGPLCRIEGTRDLVRCEIHFRDLDRLDSACVNLAVWADTGKIVVIVAVRPAIFWGTSTLGTSILIIY